VTFSQENKRKPEIVKMVGMDTKKTVRPPLEVANQAKAEAQRLRAEWLLRVETGQSTIFDVIEAAELPFSESLQAMRLATLFRADHSARRHVDAMLMRLAYEGTTTANCRVDKSDRIMRVGWFYPSRGERPDLAERRINLLYDVYVSAVSPDTAPTETFPWEY